jgi:hypothetical protein
MTYLVLGYAVAVVILGGFLAVTLIQLRRSR